MADTPRPTTAELLAELGPLHTVIVKTLATTPVRLGPGGTDQLADDLTLALALHISRDVLPVDALALANPPHPSDTTWRIEVPMRGQWQRTATGYTNRDGALDSYQNWIDAHPAMMSRLVRATTTYAIEAEHTPEQT